MVRQLGEHLYAVGVNDRKIDLFEGQYSVPNGMAYNSYLILDEKIGVFDTVDRRFAQEWLGNIREVLGERSPDYLVIQHMEPDHSACILEFMEAYPSCTVVGNGKTFRIMEQFFGSFSHNTLLVKEKDILSLGEHTLQFLLAPMVHWPEVMVTYDQKSGALFSADAFGKFGAADAEEDWACEARRYYFGIVGKYGMQVQALLQKVSQLDVRMICPLHGPVLFENLPYYVGLYDTWSRYDVESDGVVIAYTSVYGHTKEAVMMLKEELLRLGCPKVAVNDLARCDMAEAVEDAFRYGTLVLATTTYNNGIFPFMETFIHHLLERNYTKRRIAFMENGSWAPTAAKVMGEKFSPFKQIEILPQKVTILSGVTAENKEEISVLAKALLS